MKTPEFTQLQRYNVLDCCQTLALLEKLRPQLDAPRAATYSLSRALQAPILDMTQRGVLVDRVAVGTEKAKLQEEITHVRSQLNYIVHSLTGRDFNPGSYPQLRWFLFDCLGAQPIILSKKGEKKISTDREGLELMMERDEILTPFLELQLEFRDLAKTLSVLQTGLDPDGRIRCFFSIPGTSTGRLASSENAFGRGTNLQNITEDLRRLFIADPGYILCNVDLSQADSWNVALEVYRATGDRAYLEAILSGDLHTYVARLVWPELPWTGNIKEDRAIAETPFYRHYDHRFMCKKGGHGTNYLGKFPTLARQMKIPKTVAQSFQQKYLDQFPGIPEWQAIRVQELQLNKNLTTLLGRKRYFHGRLRDEKTWREAIAYLGQSPTADIINTVMLKMHRQIPEAELLLQGHDAITFQVKESLANSIIPKVLETFSVPITVTSPSGETITHSIPSEASVGYNWGKFNKKTGANPDGLVDWRGTLDDKRKRVIDPAAKLLDRKLC